MELLQQYLPLFGLTAIGLIAGWLAGLVLGGKGLIGNLIVGVAGALLGAWLHNAGYLPLPASTGSAFGDQVAISTVGAIIVVLIARLLAR